MAKIFDPIKIGKMEVKNRIVAAPMMTNYADSHGYVTQRLIDYYEEKAKGGAGLVQVECTYVRPDGIVFNRQLGVDHDRKIAGLIELAEAIQTYGAKASLQLHHGGRICGAAFRYTGTQPISPSGIYPYEGITPRELSTKEVEEVIDCFARAAGRVKEAGFDAVSIHGAHGYLISEFMSPFTNKRKDKYGGPIAFVHELIQKIRKVVGQDYPIIFRFSADEYLQEIGEEGITLDESIRVIAPALEKAGVDCLDVSAANFEMIEYCVPPMYLPRGCNLHLAERVKSVVNIPVIGVGRINDPKLAQKVIERGRVDLVALGRQLWADPEFPNKLREGRLEDIRMCLADGCCMDRVFTTGTKCCINAALGREKEYRIRAAERTKKVIVVGGGVAGMEAARIAALRGHDVTLYERRGELGGLVSMVAQMPHIYNRELGNIVKYLSAQVHKLGVRIQLGEEATHELLMALKPDIVIIATGAKPKIPSISGINNGKVLTMDDYLKGASLGQKIAIIGGIYGGEIAVSLGKSGKEVTIVEKSEEIATAPYLYIVRMKMLQKYLKESKVNVFKKAWVKEMRETGIVIMQAEGNEKFIEVDNVIIALGREPDRDLARDLMEKGIEFYEIGDCVEPRQIFNAIHEGSAVARII